jgi:predicted metalloprotease with PDZ domain
VYFSGFQSSPSWQHVFPKTKKPIFHLVPDSSVAGVCLQSPFFQQKIPALFLHTGYQNDYQSRLNGATNINLTGTVSLLNYLQRIIKNVGQEGKLQFQMIPLFSELPQPLFSVTMGIQPDHEYKGVGIQIKNVYPNQSAEVAGIQSGDVLLKLGSLPVSTMQTYRDALLEYKPGDLVQVLIRRNQREQSLFVRF